MKIYKSKKGAKKFKDGKEVKEPKMMLKKKRGKGMAGSMAEKRRAYYDTIIEHASERTGVNTKKALKDIFFNPKDYKPYKSKKK